MKYKDISNTELFNPLLEIETDKTTFEIEAPASGILLGIFFKERAIVPVMTSIAVIGKEGEEFESYKPKLEKETKELLNTLSEAKIKSKGKNRKYANNLSELINTGLLAREVEEKYWDFDIKIESGLFTYTVTATPVSAEKSGYVTFFFKDSDEKMNVIWGTQRFSIHWNAAIRTPPNALMPY